MTITSQMFTWEQSWRCSGQAGGIRVTIQWLESASGSGFRAYKDNASWDYAHCVCVLMSHNVSLSSLLLFLEKISFPLKVSLLYLPSWLSLASRLTYNSGFLIHVCLRTLAVFRTHLRDSLVLPDSSGFDIFCKYYNTFKGEYVHVYTIQIINIYLKQLFKGTESWE